MKSTGSVPRPSRDPCFIFHDTRDTFYLSDGCKSTQSSSESEEGVKRPIHSHSSELVKFGLHEVIYESEREEPEPPSTKAQIIEVPEGEEFLPQEDS